MANQSLEERPLRAAFIAFALAIGLVAALGLLAGAVPLVNEHLGVLVALVFLFVPVELAWRRGRDMAAIGFTLAPLRANALYAGVVMALIFPLFLFGFVIFYDVVCASDALSAIAPPRLCDQWRGLAGATWPTVDWAYAEWMAAQLVVVAIPEELLFRGYIHDLCERAMPPKRRLLGGGVGRALVVSSLLFAVTHLAIGFDPRRLATFFPGLLFGWLRSATGSITAAVVVHAGSNILIDLLQKAFA